MKGARLLLFCCLLGCGGKEIDVADIIEERAETQVSAIRANLLRNCEDDILEAARLRADSLLLDRARRMRRIDGRPPRPGRPGEPPPQQLSEPLPLRPLFPFEVRFDTLLRDSLLQDSLRRDSLLQEGSIDSLQISGPS